MDRLWNLLLAVVLPAAAGYAVVWRLWKYRFAAIPVMVALLVVFYARYTRYDTLAGILLSSLCLVAGYTLGRIFLDHDEGLEELRRQLIVMGLVIFGLTVAVLMPLAKMGPYFYARHLERQWKPAHPATKAEFERYLHFYFEDVVDRRTSPWGWDYVPKENERMVQYLLLWSAPLDVVYDDEDRIVRIYTSYE